jgi:hypothetical protein
MRRVQKIFAVTALLLFGSLSAFAQEQDNVKKWHNFNFQKKAITKASLAKLELYELQQLRGVLFGKRGRIFVERQIQDYLEDQKWYKPNKGYRNASLTAVERKNIDTIREAEAAKHDSVEPGDFRWWKTKVIPEEKIYAKTNAEWDVMIAEIEAIHGKTFPDQEWLQKYFDERYWYKRNPNYSATVLSETERKNLAAYIDARGKNRRSIVSFGDMGKFRNTPLTEEMLKGASLSELRLMRNEFFARRGKKYTTPGFLGYFEWQDWYKPIKDQSKVKLNATEEANVDLIKAAEAKIRNKLTTEELTEDDLGYLFTEELRALRNEIFARHGWVFKDKELQKMFESMDWYSADPAFTADKVPTVLTSVEFKNITKLKEAEETAVSKFTVVEG